MGRIMKALAALLVASALAGALATPLDDYVRA